MTEEFLFRLILASLLGGVIGLERQIRAKEAGVRTHILIGIGSAMFMIVSKYGFYDVIEHTHIGLDPSRIAAQVVTGVGFLGAGNILVQKQTIKGLTTAADVWVTAAMGLVIGSGMYEVGIIGTIMALIVLELFRQLTYRFLNRHLHLRMRIAAGTTQVVLAWITEQGYRIQLRSLANDTSDCHVLTANVEYTDATSVNQILSSLKENPAIKEVSVA
ncbi:MgtC/SapB family protein [Citrobacter freundii]|uniref:MgtC/SapB family protein n=1 Tax=Citrobacter freundii TaxID=546 RepID=UPI00292C3519|nr:MgtC/SapB family protein [Citrobacter freundii]MDV0657930.1 MgtC/SapB family protein [Citrobacter freundii]MDV0722761.1 MgtC/SapB family protein [Citrobacter freundii]MEB0617542.1 MgtC/SapB family protein [Citrobacter freundii]MEB0693630.1 MgtC/SapB family protein [Citrobacter freundii]HEM7943786.1 MgtC/SapB family protein [Citrobacter freundii]